MCQTAEEMYQEARSYATQIFQQVDILEKEGSICTREILTRAHYAALLIADDERAMQFQTKLCELADKNKGTEYE